MIELFESLRAWHWMLLGIFLLGLEILGTRGYLLGAGLAAFVSCLLALSKVEWHIQIAVFGFLGFFFTFIYFKKLRHKVSRRLANLHMHLEKQLHNEASKHSLAGTIGRVVESNIGQSGRAEVADKVWQIRCKQKLEVNDEIRVRASDGKTLHVSKII